GDVFWGLSFFEPQIKMPISLRAKGDLNVAYWSREDLVPILLENGKALWSLSSLLVRRMLLASMIVEDLAFQPVAGRIAKLLLSQYGKAGSTRIERDLTLDDMAARVGTTREMVCRVLYKFADQDVIDITRTEFSIVDKGQLSKIAGEE
ncbi:MAG: Crp/Fnr family transcriptional regulator, partial [Anaerolineales bacterium]